MLSNINYYFASVSESCL